MPRGAGHYRRFTEAEKARMIAMRREGHTSGAIAKAIGDDPKRVSDWIKMHSDLIAVKGQKSRDVTVVALPGITKARLMAGR